MVLLDFKYCHNELANGNPLEYEYEGRMLALKDLDFNCCGSNNYDYWYDGDEAAQDLVTIELILFSICEGGYRMLANSVSLIIF
jgi:hypothetical protein